MIIEDKNLKDISSPSTLQGEGRGEVNYLFYSKTNKLVTALYMVTDIMDKEEPLRNKLRILGTDIISDINSVSNTDLGKKIQKILSFLDIASTVGMISEMNCSILKKEFLKLKQFLEESSQISLSEFFENSNEEFPPLLNKEGVGGGNSKNNHLAFQALLLEKEEKNNSKGHSTSIGVQKGSTLMKALKNINMSNKKNGPAPNKAEGFRSGFDVLKKQRRDEIIQIIKAKNNATITDIRTGANGVLAQCGEKTLQRELFSMVKDNVLKKTGEKRWSRYFLPN